MCFSVVRFNKPPLRAMLCLWRHSPSAAACFFAFSLRSAMLEFLLVVFAAAAAATTEAADADSAASVASGSPNGGAGNIMYGACAARCECRWWCAWATALSSCSWACTWKEKGGTLRWLSYGRTGGKRGEKHINLRETLCRAVTGHWINCI